MNSFVPNSTILSSSVNANFTDIATGLSDVLTRDGQAGMTAAFKAIAGSLGAPGISFTSDATSGLYLSTTGIVGLVAKSLGLLVNSSIYQATAATVVAGGSGYAVGDVIQETGGTVISSTTALLQVATISGSAVATVTVLYPGNYTVVPSNPVSQLSTDGSGTGATFNLTFAAQFAKSVVTDESGALPWSRLGASSFAASMFYRSTAYNWISALLTAGSGIAISHATNPVISATLNPTLVPNYLSGLTLSTAGGSAIMSIAAGVANDSTNATLMKLSSAIGKTTASWVVGNNTGGLDTGAIANSTWYHFYEIERTDTSVVDVLFSLSASSPTMPTNYTLKRRIGSGKTDGSGLWTAFTQTGDEFIWSTPVLDANAITVSTSRQNLTLTVPTGIVVQALMRGISQPGSTLTIIVTSLEEADQAPGTTNCDLFPVGASGASVNNLQRLTDTSARVGYRSDTNSSVALSLRTYGWVDTRGQ